MDTIFETMLDITPPAWLRKTEAMVLMHVFADAFDVEPAALENYSAEGALMAFREFTAACMEAALADEMFAEYCRLRLGTNARMLGSKVRKYLPVTDENAFRVVRFFYRGIGIEIAGELPGALCFCPCSFAQRYTPRDCWLMSAFDEGFMRGVTGIDATLEFSCRLTEGADCCRAQFD